MVWASPTRVTSYPRTIAPCRVERMHSSVCAPASDDPADAGIGQHGLEDGVLERVGVVLADDGLAVGRNQFGHELPVVAVAHQLLVGVLHPDHGHAFVARPIDQRSDPGDHLVAVVGAGDHAVLHVDDEQGRIGSVLESRHCRSFPFPFHGNRRIRQDEDMVDSIADSLSEAALEAATGHDSVHWFALLDAAGAMELAHRPIVELAAGTGRPGLVVSEHHRAV